MRQYCPICGLIAVLRHQCPPLWEVSFAVVECTIVDPTNEDLIGEVRAFSGTDAGERAAEMLDDIMPTGGVGGVYLWVRCKDGGTWQLVHVLAAVEYHGRLIDRKSQP